VILHLDGERRRALVSSGWSFDGGDAGSFLRDVVHGRDAARGFGLSNFGFQRDVLDRAIEEMLVAATPAERRSSFERAMTLALREVPALPLFHVPLVYGVAPDLVFEPRLDGRLLAHEMRFLAPQNE
jgi:peptide/nickel transport system substrate-binding protein